VIAGLKSYQLTSNARLQFDRISRSEQVIMEHVNNFTKKISSISKAIQFQHSKELQAGCVIISCGWYNYMWKYYNKYQ